MKNMALVLFALATSSPAFAGTCGAGKTIENREGYWGQDGLSILIDYSRGSSAHFGTEFQDLIRFGPGLSEDRLDGIRALATLSIGMGFAVETYSHSSKCAAATELGMLSE